MASRLLPLPEDEDDDLLDGVTNVEGSSCIPVQTLIHSKEQSEANKVPQKHEGNHYHYTVRDTDIAVLYEIIELMIGCEISRPHILIMFIDKAFGGKGKAPFTTVDKVGYS